MRAATGTLLLSILLAQAALAAWPAERLDRGLVALHFEQGKVAISWRLLAGDPEDVAFNVYRMTAGAGNAAGAVKLNAEPLTRSTHFVDGAADLSRPTAYFVRAARGGRELEPSPPFAFEADAPVRNYLSIPLRTPAGYMPNDASVGDLDGDGRYEVVLHQAGRGRDNAQRGVTDPPILQAYTLDGRMLWEVNLGRNVREGAHYVPFLVFDLDGDGRAEVACRTADGTVDGTGKVLGDAAADHRDADGYVLRGPEYLTVFDGLTGRVLATADYVPARGDVRAWGDNTGNRADRFLAAVAYLDGRRPSLVFCRGYYTRAVLAAWDFRDGQLSRLWTFDSDDGTPGNRAYRGQGYHSLSVADVDGDGRDEVVYGAAAIDDDGKGLCSTGLGHGDALHVSDLDPDRPGLKVFGIHERARHDHAVNLRDARTGKVIWGKPSGDVGRGLAADIDPRHAGAECWASGQGLRGLWSAQGQVISDRRPRSCNFAVWWDGDLLRELLDRNAISKWDWEAGADVRLLTAEGCSSNNGTKATPALSADILGDWREEVLLRTTDGRELRLFTTPIPTEHRLVTLMHDRQYRLAVAWQNVGYNQPPHPSFFLGHGMKAGGRAAEPAAAPAPVRSP